MIANYISEQRNFCFAIELAIKKIHNYNRYEIGTGNTHSVNELLDVFKYLKIYETRNSPKIEGEIQDISIDTSKALKDIGFSSRINLDTGIKEFYV